MEASASGSTVSDERLFKTKDFFNFYEFFQNGDFYDVTIIADNGKKIPVHRIVICAANVYFKKMFSVGMKERSQSEIAIKEVDGDILELLVKYCYTGEIAIDSAIVDPLIKAATMLQFTTVRENCSEFYSGILHESNCLGIQEVADFHNMPQLKATANTFVLNHFMDVSKCSEFYALSEEQLSDLLKNDALNVVQEMDAFEAVMRWAKHDIENRKSLLETVLGCVRFKLIKEPVLLTEVNRQCIEINCRDLFSLIVERRSSEPEGSDELPRRSFLVKAPPLADNCVKSELMECSPDDLEYISITPSLRLRNKYRKFMFTRLEKR